MKDRLAVPCDRWADRTKVNELASMRVSAERVGRVGRVARLAQLPIYMEGVGWSKHIKQRSSNISHSSKEKCNGWRKATAHRRKSVMGRGYVPTHQADLHEGWHEVLVTGQSTSRGSHEGVCPSFRGKRGWRVCVGDHPLVEDSGEGA